MNNIINDLRSKIIESEYIAFNLCDIDMDCAGNADKYYNLLKTGDKVYRECIDEYPTPLLSEAGTLLLSNYLKGVVFINPDPLTL
jgi:hypothetical protein